MKAFAIMWRIAYLLAGATIALASSAYSASPPTTSQTPLPTSPGCVPGTPCAVVTPVQLFDLAERFAKAGRVKNAEAMLRALTQHRDPDIRAEARFRLGNLYQSIGNLEAAAHAYRDLLDEKPGASPVRLELARVLARMGQDDAARSQLRRASTAGLPNDVARVVDQFQAALRSHRTLGANMEADLAPDSNINHASGRSTADIGSNVFQLSKDAQAQSGLGVQLTGQAFWRPKISSAVNWLSTLSGSANLYGKGRFDDISASIATGPEFLFGNSRLRPAGIVTRRWFGGDVYSDSRGGTINLLQPISRTSQVQFDVTVLDNHYHINPGLTGSSASGLARYEIAFSPRLFGRLSFRVDRQNARESAFATWTVGGEALLSRDVGRETIYARVGFYRTLGDTVFNLPPVRRNDRLIDLEAGLLVRRLAFHGLVPILRVERTENHSPVFFYDYRRTRLEVGVTHEF